MQGEDPYPAAGRGHHRGSSGAQRIDRDRTAGWGDLEKVQDHDWPFWTVTCEGLKTPSSSEQLVVSAAYSL